MGKRYGITRKALREYRVLETSDFLEMLKRSLLSKCALMREYPHMYAFSLRAYYETNLEIQKAVQDSFSDACSTSERLGAIGHSLGGRIAVRFINEQPELFHFAVFLSTWGTKSVSFRLIALFRA